tara:strand:+ start:69 stop:470 length:402 start_codon:yes stop_codon:yes gene_type:complete
MANIQLQRGLKQDIDVTYTLANSSKPDLRSGFDAELVIRQKEKGKFSGAVVDVLRHDTSSPEPRSSADGRITFEDPSSGDGHNITLSWTTAQASLLPNLAQTVAGDLKVTSTSSSEVVHHIRLTFDIIPEIIE